MPGEFYASRDDILISTLLGSCISVALYDPLLPVGGLNHFLLPFPKNSDNPLFSNSARYGINAMEVLINSIMNLGGKKNRFVAKVFGGSASIDYKKKATYNIPKMNIHFVFEFLENERIPVEAYSVGGTLPRRIYFFPKETRVLMKYSKDSPFGLIRQETEYSETLLEKTKNDGKPILF